MKPNPSLSACGCPIGACNHTTKKNRISLTPGLSGKWCHRRSGFTLVELLATLGIVAILGTLLFPSLSNARQRAQGATCAGNLRQIGALTVIYIQDHDGRFPSAWSGEGMWLDTLIAETQYGGDLTKAHTAMSAKNSFSRCPLRVGSEAECNAIFDASTNWYQTGDQWWYDYGMNYTGLSPADSGTPTPIKLVSIDKPSQTIFVADGNIKDGAAPWLINPGWSGAYPSDRHQGKSNVLWVDGHVTSETLAWLTDPENNHLWQPSL